MNEIDVSEKCGAKNDASEPPTELVGARPEISNIPMEKVRHSEFWGCDGACGSITMKIYVFAQDSRPLKSQYGLEAIRIVLERVAATTDVRDLVVAVYMGQTAIKIRALRRNSKRLAIKTADGHPWHWPMAWLEPVDHVVELVRCAEEKPTGLHRRS